MEAAHTWSDEQQATNLRSQPACVYVVDDDTSARELISAFLRPCGYQIVTFGSATDFLQEVRLDNEVPTCLISDVCMPSIDGLALQQRLRSHRVDMPIIFVSAMAGISAAVDAMKCGALDFHVKPLDRAKLVKAVEKAIEQDAAAKVRRLQQQACREKIARLTSRERQVMELLAQAKGTKEIASMLGISPKTVFVHRARVLEKMGADNLVELSRQVVQV